MALSDESYKCGAAGTGAILFSPQTSDGFQTGANNVKVTRLNADHWLVETLPDEVVDGTVIHNDAAWCRGNGELYHMPLRLIVRSSGHCLESRHADGSSEPHRTDPAIHRKRFYRWRTPMRPALTAALLLNVMALAACADDANPLATETSAVGTRATPVTTVRFQERVPFDGAFFNECTDEFVDAVGTINVTSVQVWDAAGNLVHEKFHPNPQGLRGVGRSSGRGYVVAGSENNSFQAYQTGAWQVMFVGILRMITPGSDENLHLHFQFFVKVDASGNFNLHIGNISTNCR